MIQIIDRKTGQLQEERVYGHAHLMRIYGEGFLAKCFSYSLLPLLALCPWFSRLYGWLQRRKASARSIQPFIEEYGVDASEFVKKEFSSFNDFFIRTLKPECRPILGDPKRAVLPADGRYLVFPKIREADGFFVKGRKFSLRTFLQDPILARRYGEGSMVIARLCPFDYHRFHFPCSGTPSDAREIPGALYSVNPLALKRRPTILSENKRKVTEIDTDQFGVMLYVEVGATFVGTIHETYLPFVAAKKGEEKGYFSFGGSCLVLLFEKGTIRFDADLVAHSRQGRETYARFGESLGVVGSLH